MHSLKSRVQRMLLRLGVYYRLKESSVYELYWRLLDPRVITARDAEVNFYRQVLEGLRPGALIFDVGANEGAKTDVFLRLGARVVAVEPDEQNQQALAGRFHRWRLQRKPVLIEPMAVSDSVGSGVLIEDQPGSAKNTMNPKWAEILRKDITRFGRTLDFGSRKQVHTTTLDTLIAKHGVPQFIKIDVEGLEATVLRGLQREVPYVSFEVNLPEFYAEGVECIEQLLRTAPGGRFNCTSAVSDGFLLKDWLDARTFTAWLADCHARSVEVFWSNKTTV
jgi:FkbM family methyltransferase